MVESYIDRVLQGERKAFRFIISEYKDHAYSLAVSVVKNEFDAKDVVQNAFIKAYNKLETFNRDAKFSTWFYRIVINEAFNKLRSLNKDTVSLDSSDTDVSPNSSDKTFSDAEVAIQRYYINQALKMLPAKYSVSLRLFYLEEKSIDEITKITGWTESNTKVILHRARNKMEDILTNTFNLDKEALY